MTDLELEKNKKREEIVKSLQETEKSLMNGEKTYSLEEAVTEWNKFLEKENRQ